MYVDVNLGQDSQRIALYEDTVPRDAARKFANEHQLDTDALDNLTLMLEE